MISLNKFKFALVLTAILVVPQTTWAHALELKNLSTTDVSMLYLKLGFTHIIPLGLDHILFILSLFLLSTNVKIIIKQSLAFTLAHSLTLGLVIYGVITPPSHIIEPIIALSIMFVALENIVSSSLKPSRLVLIVIFGLIHGMGFASVLNDLGLPEDKFLTSLITFNVGVELGQISIIIGAWCVFGYWFKHKTWYRKRIVIPISICIAAISFYWVIERIFFV